MAKAKRCDRCKAYYDTYNYLNNEKKTSGIMYLNVDSDGRYYQHGAIDLCPACMKLIREVIDGEVNTVED